MRTGTGEDFVVSDPTALECALIERLAEGFCDEAGLRGEFRLRGLPTASASACLTQLDELGLLEWQAAGAKLSASARERYDRQLIYWADVAGRGESAEDLQHRLACASVVIVGCGGLGSWVASALACAGVGRLVLIDHDRVELSNLNRQLLFSEADIGRLKVDAAAAALVAHNSELEVVALPRLVSGPSDLTGELERADLLVATADWPPYEIARWINTACLSANVPYISAGQFPPRVRIGPMVVPGRSACLECIERHARNEHPLYAEAVAATPSPSTAASFASASGAAGSLLAMEALHLLTRSSTPASLGAALILDLRLMELSREAVERDPKCLRCRHLGE
jgi:bacteriocin biosynthesis cyclodehydratase domain-containing protein